MKQIGARRESFFAAVSKYFLFKRIEVTIKMKSIQEFQEEVVRACDTIEYLRWQLKEADEELACKTLHIPQLKGRRQQLRSVYKKVQLQLLSHVWKMFICFR